MSLSKQFSHLELEVAFWGVLGSSDIVRYVDSVKEAVMDSPNHHKYHIAIHKGDVFSRLSLEICASRDHTGLHSSVVARLVLFRQVL